MFATETRNGANMVGVADLPIDADEPAALTEQRLDGARDGAIGKVRGKLLKNQPIIMAGKYPGREFTASLSEPANGLVRARIWLVGKRLYQVMVIGTDTYAGSTSSTDFLDSFRLID
jgi:hypothetical protein